MDKLATWREARRRADQAVGDLLQQRERSLAQRGPAPAAAEVAEADRLCRRAHALFAEAMAELAVARDEFHHDHRR